MIYSMTAFARETAPVEEGLLTVELRTVNHRYFDCSFKLPETLRALEPALRQQAGQVLSRGKLDVLFRLQANPENTSQWHINMSQLDSLLAAADVIEQRAGVTRNLNALEILQFPGICASSGLGEEALQKQALALFSRALDSLADSRRREGQKLAELILERLQLVAEEVATTRQLLPDLLQQQRQRISDRIAELAMETNEPRLEQELVYLAQKADVDEELDRLTAHISEVRHTLEKGSPCGRRLDFLMQEFKANTLSSKSIDSSTTRNAVELKVLIEQMREQVQNIE